MCAAGFAVHLIAADDMHRVGAVVPEHDGDRGNGAENLKPGDTGKRQGRFYRICRCGTRRPGRQLDLRAMAIRARPSTWTSRLRARSHRLETRAAYRKCEGVTQTSRNPLISLVRLQDQQSSSNLLIQNENGVEDWNMNPQTYPQSVEPMRMRLSSEKLSRKSPIAGRLNRKLLEIWRYMLNSARKPYWSRVQLSPSISPKHSFTWRQSWR